MIAQDVWDDYPFVSLLAWLNRVNAVVCFGLGFVGFIVKALTGKLYETDGWYMFGLLVGSALGCAVAAELLLMLARIEINTRH